MSEHGRRLKALEGGLPASSKDRDLTPVELRICERYAAKRGCPVEHAIALVKRCIQTSRSRSEILAMSEYRAQREGVSVEDLLDRSLAHVRAIERELEAGRDR